MRHLLRQPEEAAAGGAVESNGLGTAGVELAIRTKPEASSPHSTGGSEIAADKDPSIWL